MVDATSTRTGDVKHSRFARFCVSAGVLLAVAVAVHAGARGQQDQPVYDNEVETVGFEDVGYPDAARKAGVEGAVVVGVSLDAAGTVTSAAALSGPALLVPAAIENAKLWRFKTSAQRRVLLVYEFRLEGTCQRTWHSLFRLVHFNLASISACRAAS